jgi:hypothetical protein
MYLEYPMMTKLNQHNIGDLNKQTNEKVFATYPKRFTLTSVYDNKHNQSELLDSGLISNVDHVMNNFDWIKKQYEYFKKLSFEDKYIVQNYTYHGDVYANNFIRGTLEIKSDIDLMPLYYQIVKILKKAGKDDLKYFLKDSSDFTNVKDSLKPYKKKDYSDFTEKEIVDFVALIKSHVLKKFNRTFINQVISLYCEDLNRIIRDSPPLDSKITLYRGTKGDSYMKFNDKKEYVSNDFWSCSMVLSEANKFTNQVNCCVHKINLLPNVKCLAIFYASKFEDELEILLGPSNTFFLQQQGEIYNLPLKKKMSSKTLLCYG